MNFSFLVDDKSITWCLKHRITIISATTIIKVSSNINWAIFCYDNNVSYVNDVKTKYDNEYRVWQINQPIQNMNGEISVPIEIDKKLQQSSIVAKLGYKN